MGALHASETHQYLSYKLKIKPIFHWDAKPFALGPGVGGLSQQFCVGDTNMLVSKNAKNAIICVTPTPIPNLSRWNIGGVGSPMQISCIGHSDFMLFVHHFPRWHRKRRFWWNTGLSVYI